MRGRAKLGHDVPCAHCGAPVHRAPSQMGRRFCSHACRDAAKMLKRVRDGRAKCSKCGEWKPIDQFVKGVGGRPHSHCKPCNAKWHVPDQDRKQAYRPAYRLTPEQKAENKRERNQRQHSARRAGGRAPGKDDVRAMLERQSGVCAFCMADISDGYHIDHKLPVSRGGTNAVENLQLLCPKCNLSKGAQTVDEFLVSKRRRVVSWDERMAHGYNILTGGGR